MTPRTSGTSGTPSLHRVRRPEQPPRRHHYETPCMASPRFAPGLWVQDRGLGDTQEDVAPCRALRGPWHAMPCQERE